MDRDFYIQSPEIVATELIGCVFSHKINAEQTLSVRLTETEAYLSTGDEACHASRGRTPRTAPMFLEGGILYIYFIYGMHWLTNIVTEKEGTGSAVLLRAGVNVEGPGRLTRHLGINHSHNAMHIDGKVFELHRDELTEEYQHHIEITKRIGITKSADLPLRFVVNRNIVRKLSAHEVALH